MGFRPDGSPLVMYGPPPFCKRRMRLAEWSAHMYTDRKSTRLNSSHLVISYAVFCLKKKEPTALHVSSPPADITLLAGSATRDARARAQPQLPAGPRHPSAVVGSVRVYFFFNDTATTEIYTLSLHDALPISMDARAADEFYLRTFAEPALDIN